MPLQTLELACHSVKLSYLLYLACTISSFNVSCQESTVIFRSRRQEDNKTRTNETVPQDTCSGTVNVAVEEIVNITTPGYPISLPIGFIHCDWKIIADRSNYRVSMKFLVIDFPPPTSRGQCLDGFLAYGGYDWLGRQVVEGASICGGGGGGRLGSRRFISGSRTAWLSVVLSNRGRQRGSADNVDLFVEISLVKNDRLLGDVLIGVCCALFFIVACCVPFFCYGRRRSRRGSESRRQRRLFHLQCSLRLRLELINAKSRKDQYLASTRVPEVNVEEAAVEKAFERTGRHRSSLRKMMLMVQECRHQRPYSPVGNDFGGSCGFIAEPSDGNSSHLRTALEDAVPPSPVTSATMADPISTKGLIQAMMSPRPRQQQQQRRLADPAPGETSKSVLQRHSSKWPLTDNDYDEDNPAGTGQLTGHETALAPVIAKRFHIDGGKRQSIASVGNEYSFLSPAGDGHMCSTPLDATGSQVNKQVIDERAVRAEIDDGADLDRYTTPHSLPDESLTGSDPIGRPSSADELGIRRGGAIDYAQRPFPKVKTSPSSSPAGSRLGLASPTEQTGGEGSSDGSTGVPLLEPIREEDSEEASDDDEFEDVADVVPLGFDVDGGSSKPPVPPPPHADAPKCEDNTIGCREESVDASLVHGDAISEVDRRYRDSDTLSRFDNGDVANVRPPTATSAIRSSMINLNDKTERRLSGDRHVSFYFGGEVEDTAELTSVSALSCTEFSALTPGSSSSASDSVDNKVLMKFVSTSSRANDQRYPTSMNRKSAVGVESVGKRGDETSTGSTPDELEHGLDRSRKISAPLHWRQNLSDTCVDSSSTVVDRWCQSKDRSTNSALHKFDNTADTSIWPTSNVSCFQLESDVIVQSSFINVYHDYVVATDDDAIGCYGDGDPASNSSTEIAHKNHPEEHLSDIPKFNDDVTSVCDEAHHKLSIIGERKLTSRRPPDSGSSKRCHHGDDDVDVLELVDFDEAAASCAASSVVNDGALTLVAERDVPRCASKESGTDLMANVVVASKRSPHKHSFVNRMDDLLPPPPSRRQRRANQQVNHTAANKPAVHSSPSSADVVGPTRSSRTVPVDLSSSSTPEAEGVGRAPTWSRTSFADGSTATASRRLNGKRHKVGFGFVSESKF